jgi:acetoin utilization deacetylase AcuC-like enzyme/GNAT superfamily N-acetyltransferase
MFRIRRIYDDVLPTNQLAIREVKRIFADQFPAASADDIEKINEKLRNPFMQRFRTVLYVAENARGHVIGFAIMLQEPVLSFCYLDYITTAKGISGRGIGAALYEYVRDEAVTLRAKALWFECLPDEPAACLDETIRAQNAERIKFYERFGVRRLAGTAYETPVPGGACDNLPHLMVDLLDRTEPLSADYVRRVVRAVLERKYGEICPPSYVHHVTRSIVEPIRLGELRYVAKPIHRPAAATPPERIALAINDKHEIHHVRERGYVESPVRIRVIQNPLIESGLTDLLPVKEYPLKHITAVHDADFVDDLRTVSAATPHGKSIYPYVFPIRNAARPPQDLTIRAGYYCIDTFTPIHENAFAAAKRAVDCTLTTTDAILRGRRIGYALVRPPGHHAERRSFGGFCYFNNAAVAAHYLSRLGKVAILDIDYHHGNGQQDIFYHRADVFTVSIHGDPDFAYPYFSGFADERGTGAGEEFNLNLPLPEKLSSDDYRRALKKALNAVRQFAPAVLIVALGLDIARGDPTGTWSLRPRDFEENGRMIGELLLPTLVVQEGGYRTRTLGTNALRFFYGFINGSRQAQGQAVVLPPPRNGVVAKKA